MMSAPGGIFPAMPAQGYQAPQYTPRPVNPPAPLPCWQQYAPEQQPAIQEAAPRGAIYRGKADDEAVTETVTAAADSRPEPLNLPSPEQLGVGCGCGKCECSPCNCKAPVDWAELHHRLEKLGALSFHEQKLTEGGYRVSFLLPTDRENRSQHVEATAETAIQAAQLALDRAEKLASRK